MSRSSARLKEKDIQEPETKRISTRSSSAVGKTGNTSPQQKNAANKNKKNEMNPPPSKPAGKKDAPSNVRVTRSKAVGSGGSGKKQSVSNDDSKGGKRKSRSASPQQEKEGVRRSTRSKRTVDKLTAAEENKASTSTKRNKREKTSRKDVKVHVPSTSTGRNRSTRNSRQTKKKPETSNVKLSFDDEYDSLLDDEEDETDEEEEDVELDNDEGEDKAEDDENEEEENEESQSRVVTVIQKVPKDKNSSKKAEETKKDAKKADEKTNKKKVYGTNRNSVSSATRSGMVDRSPTIKILEIRVVNKGTNYSIWRKLFVTDEIKVTQLARVIVACVGWMGYRDWEFEIHGLRVVVPPDDDDDREEETQIKRYADNVFLNEFNLHVDDKLYFNYGIDDNPWVHEITIEAIHEVDRNPKSHSDKSHSVNHAVVVTGMGACPNDVEHPKEFDKAMEAFLKGPEEFEKYHDKLGEGFDPQYFDKESINEQLKIYLYDTSKMDAKLLEDDKFFKY